MQNLKYHIINIAAVTIFSYTGSSAINNVVRHNISPVTAKSVRKSRKISHKKVVKTFDRYKHILESGFFKVASTDIVSSPLLTESRNESASIDNLSLMGTITGPRSIARAMIKKRGERNPEIFRLWSEVYGYKLIAIRSTKVYLKLNNERYVLDLFAKKKNEAGARRNINTGRGRSIKQSISRAEIKQKVMNNLDNAMRGLVAGPYRVNGKIVGFRLKKVRPYNILYKMGARSGDIVKRVNGHVIDSTPKLMKLWESLKNEPKITVDIERGGNLISFDLNITE